MDTTEINLVSKSRVLATWNVRGREGEKTFLVETMTRKFRVLLSVGRQILDHVRVEGHVIGLAVSIVRGAGPGSPGSRDHKRGP